MEETARWYVAHTYSGYENKVAQNIATVVENRKLQELIQEVKIPTEKVTEIKDNVKKEVERKLFPSYVFIKMILTDNSWYIVKSVKGVTGFVGPSSKPLPLSKDEVEKLGVEVRQITVEYEIGDNVEVIDGPMEGFTGQVEALDLEANKVTVIVSMFGRDTPVDLELAQIKVVK